MKDYTRNFLNLPMGELIEADVLLDIMTYLLVKGNMFEADGASWELELYSHCRFVHYFSDPERKAVHLHFEMILDSLESLIQDQTHHHAH